MDIGDKTHKVENSNVSKIYNDPMLSAGKSFDMTIFFYRNYMKVEMNGKSVYDVENIFPLEKNNFLHVNGSIDILSIDYEKIDETCEDE